MTAFALAGFCAAAGAVPRRPRAERREGCRPAGIRILKDYEALKPILTGGRGDQVRESGQIEDSGLCGDHRRPGGGFVSTSADDAKIPARSRSSPIISAGRSKTPCRRFPIVETPVHGCFSSRRVRRRSGARWLRGLTRRPENRSATPSSGEVGIEWKLIDSDPASACRGSRPHPLGAGAEVARAVFTRSPV